MRTRPSEERLDLRLVACPTSAATPCFVNVLPSTAASWTQRALLGRRARRAARRAARAASPGTASASIGPVGRYDVAAALEQAAVEQHAHGLDRVQRHAFGAGEDLARAARREPGTKPSSSASIASSRERLERERRRVAATARELSRSAISGRASASDEERELARPLEQVVDEVEQARLGPLEVLEDEHARRPARRAARRRAARPRRAPARSAAVALAEPEQVGEPRLEPRALLRVGDVHARAWRAASPAPRRSAPPRRSARASAPSPRAPSTRRPRRRRGSGRGATRPRRSRPSMYFSNSQARRDLPMPAMPITETRCALPSSALAWKSSLTSRSSRSRPTNGGSRPADLQRAAARGDDAQRAEERDRLGLALQLVLAGVLVGDRRLGRALRRLADEHGAGLGRRLDARRRC